MAFTKLDTNVAINQTMPDRPNIESGLTGDQMKEVLDRAAVIIKSYLNTSLIPELEATTAAESIGAPALTAESGETVAEQLAYVLDQIEGVSQGGISDGAVTMAKLATAVRALVDRELQLFIKDANGTYTFTPTVGGNYFVLLVGAGSGTNGANKNKYSGSGTSYFAESDYGYAGGVAVKLCALTANTSYTVTVGKGGAGGTIPDTEQQTNYGNDGGDTTFKQGSTTIFTATGGKRTSATPGSGTGGDIIFPASVPRTVTGEYTSGNGSSYMAYPSKNILSQPLTDVSDTGKWGATGVRRMIGSGGNRTLAGIDGGDGAAVIFYLG